MIVLNEAAPHLAPTSRPKVKGGSGKVATLTRSGKVALHFRLMLPLAPLLLAALLLLLAGSPAAAAPTESQDLLALATKVADVKKDWDQGHGAQGWDHLGNTYFWMTNGQVLVFRFKGRTRSREDVWQLSRRDLRTRRETPLTALSALLNRNSIRYLDASLSPDGRRLLFPAFGGYCTAALNGSQLAKWPIRSGWVDAHWLGDSRHWVGLTNDYKTYIPLRATVYDLFAPRRHRTVRVVPVAAFQARPGSPFGLRMLGWDGRVRARSFSWEAVSARSHVIEVGLGEHAAVRTFTLSAPPGYSFTGVQSNAPLWSSDFSPRGDRVTWVCQSQGQSGAASRQFTLWVSRTDGSQMVEIGGFAVPAGDAEPYPHDLRWLPDEKHLSFVYDDGLYTVPVPCEPRNLRASPPRLEVRGQE